MGCEMWGARGGTRARGSRTGGPDRTSHIAHRASRLALFRFLEQVRAGRGHAHERLRRADPGDGAVVAVRAPDAQRLVYDVLEVRILDVAALDRPRGAALVLRRRRQAVRLRLVEPE